MFPPLPVWKPFHPEPGSERERDTARERERERVSRGKLLHRPPLYLPALPPPPRPPLSIPPLLFPCIQICQWDALPLSRPITEPVTVESLMWNSMITVCFCAMCTFLLKVRIFPLSHLDVHLAESLLQFEFNSQCLFNVWQNSGTAPAEMLPSVCFFFLLFFSSHSIEPVSGSNAS